VATKTEWANHELPWYHANRRIGSASLRLHNEIVELTQLLRPTREEDAQRMEAHKLLADVVQDVFPGCTLEIFGSFATGLHLPTSDVDCVILNSNLSESQVPTALQGLGRKLQKQNWVRDLEVRLASVWTDDNVVDFTDDAPVGKLALLCGANNAPVQWCAPI
jgi:predicted nucleotidyltransferase